MIDFVPTLAAVALPAYVGPVVALVAGLPAYVIVKILNPGFFARMFGAESKQPTPQRYRIVVRSANDATTVSVLNAQGQPDASPSAQRIVQVLATDLN